MEPTKKLVATLGLVAATTLFVLIPKEEGRPARGYLDPAGIPTKCFGDTKNVVVGKVYSDAECAESLNVAIYEHCNPVLSATPHLKKSQYALVAACSFSYNAGVGAWYKTDAKRYADRNDIVKMCKAFMWNDKGQRIYIKARNRNTGQYDYLKGLDKRRQLERLLCEKDVQNPEQWEPMFSAKQDYVTILKEVDAELVKANFDYNLNDLR